MKKSKAWEVIVVIIVVALAVGVFVWRKGAVKDVNEAALIDQLKSLNLAVATYLEVNKTYPPDLKTLVTEKFTYAGQKKPYLNVTKVDKDGNPVDPFGHQFNYDPATGKVTPSEPEYAGW